MSNSYPRVTQIIERTRPLNQQDRLTRYYGQIGAIAQNLQARYRGDQVDQWAKFYLSANPIAINQQYRQWTQPLKAALDQIRDNSCHLSVDVSVTYEHPQTPYRGTIDLVNLTQEGELQVIEIKTRTRHTPTLPAQQDAFLQLGGYAMALQQSPVIVDHLVLIEAFPGRVEIIQVEPALNIRLFQQRLTQFYSHVLST